MDSQSLTDLIKEAENADLTAFEPYAYYGEEEDVLTMYFRGDADYTRRINSRANVMLSLDTDELVGVQIKSVRHLLEDI